MEPTPKEPLFWLDNSNFCAVYFPADYVGQHEAGIEDLSYEFGIRDDENITDVRRFQANVVPKSLLFEEGHRETVLTVGYHLYSRSEAGLLKNLPGGLKGSSHIKDDHRVSFGAWDRSSFGLRCFDKKHRKYLTQLKNAIDNKNVAIFITDRGDNPFARGGLTVAILDMIPKEEKQRIQDKLVADKKMLDSAKATGIQEKLLAAGKRFYGLLPSGNRMGKTTQYNVVFHLNTIEYNCNSGWFTVEELEQWIENKGPVLKENNDQKAS